MFEGLDLSERDLAALLSHNAFRFLRDRNGIE